MITKLIDYPRSLSLPIHGALLIVSIAAFRAAKAKLDVSYAAAKHPVDFFTGQTSFNGETIKGYYAAMQDHGTLDIYWQTQLIDFLFIAGVFLVGVLASSMVMRFTKNDGYATRVARAAGVFLVSGALCDAIENLISFFMLSRHESFANWIALPYSGFAAIKFLFIALGMFSLILSLVLLAVEKLRREKNKN